jgi:hypothetical protein
VVFPGGGEELISPRSPQRNTAFHFNILPNTGIQIRRGLRIPDPEKLLGVGAEELWEAATREAAACAQRETVRLITDHIACNPSLESTGWVACDPTEAAFFRLTRPDKGMAISVDMVIDTHAGAGRQITNQIDCLVKMGRVWPFARQLHLASFYVASKAQAIEGSLIMDFGNSGCSFIFSETGSGAMSSLVTPLHNPFDPLYRNRTPDQLAIFKSSMIVLKAEQNPRVAPWLVMGARSEELIQQHPWATYLYAPKKYIRHWPKDIEDKALRSLYRGVIGHRPDLHPRLEFVEESVSHLVQLVLSSLTNPNYAADQPRYSPKFQRVMLTYPLTWRDSDKNLFAGLVRDEVLKLIDLPEPLRRAFQVEMICSEPVAVAAYVLWETIFQFRHANLALAASLLGNTTGSSELRLLVVDIGGGSTDIALIQVGWQLHEADDTVDVTFKLLESMRFNRAGDRLSHILATAIWSFLKEKYGLVPFDFEDTDSDSGFTLENRREAISEFSRLAEEAKVAISKDRPWSLADDVEKQVMRRFEFAGRTVAPANHDGGDARPADGPTGARVRNARTENKDSWRLTITPQVFLEWVKMDQQSRETEGEPGFMDIFHYLGDLRSSLADRGQLPHLTILSGRSTRLEFIRDLAAVHLKMPPHRIRTLKQILPESLKIPDYENLDKLAVVRGAQRFRFGDDIRFITLPEEPVFKRFIGTVRDCPNGLELNPAMILARPGDSRPRTITLDIGPRDVRIGNAFRENSPAEVLATFSNTSRNLTHRVTIDILDDHTVRMAKHEKVLFTEWVPGGTDIIVDNFNDTGRIDREPDGLIERIIRKNKDEWIVTGPNHANPQE